MYCPNCGKANSSEQKFCRSCGLNLDGANQSLVDQLPAAEHQRALVKRKQLVERLLLSMAGMGISGFAAIMLWKIITEVILDKGQVLGGLAAIICVLGIVVALALVLYRQFLIEATAKQIFPPVETPLPEPTRHQLADPYFEPVPSVIESTTELLATAAKPAEKPV